MQQFRTILESWVNTLNIVRSSHANSLISDADRILRRTAHPVNPKYAATNVTALANLVIQSETLILATIAWTCEAESIVKSCTGRFPRDARS